MRKFKAAVKLAVIFVLTFSSRAALSQAEIKLGVWEVDNGMECSETFTFLSDKSLLLESGEQIAQKAYKLKQYRKTDFYILTQRTTSHNNQLNCAGSLGLKVDSRFKVFIRLDESGDEMSFYTSPSEEDKIDIVAIKRKVEPPTGDEEEIISDTPMEF